VTGRFLSVDPAGESAKPARPQSWNRYSYGLNNPVKYVDPDGQAPQEAGSGSPTTLEQAIEGVFSALRKIRQNQVILMDGERDKKNAEIEGAVAGGLELARAIEVGFEAVFSKSTPEDDEKKIRSKEGSYEDAEQDFQRSADPESVKSKENGALVGKDKQTGNTLILRRVSTDPAATATLEEQRTTEGGRVRSRKIRYRVPER
jgi:uncharacterized protein RhaS with RHS repeats